MSVKYPCLILLIYCLYSPCLAQEVTTPPPALREHLQLSSFYTKYINVDEFPILASHHVSDYALKEAAYLLQSLMSGRHDILHAISEQKIRLAIMSTQEFTTDIPEHSTLAPADYWNRRARGLGATVSRPAVSCGEENLLCLRGDPYQSENIFIHEFAHVIHEFGLAITDPTFDAQLMAAYRLAKSSDRWQNHYALTNHREYWAEGVQSWFSCNRPTDPVNDRRSLMTYDPPLYKLLAAVFRDNAWTYTRPDQRVPPSAHLLDFNRDKSPIFVWPVNLIDALKPETKK